MTTSIRTTRSASAREILSARSLFGSLGLLMVGYGLVTSLVGIRATTGSFPTIVIGLLTAAFYCGFLPGTLMASRFLGRVGHIRVFSALAATTAASVLAYPLLVTPLAWIVLKFITGFCLAGMYVVAESWLNAISTNQTRGRLLSVYLLVSNIGFGGGQGLLGLEDGSTTAFLIGSMLFSLAIVPLTLSVAPAPTQTYSEGPVMLHELVRLVPLAITTSAVVGVATGSVLGLGAAYGTIAGMGVGRVAVLMAAAMVGGLILQWPLGSLSDRYSRRLVILAATTVAGIIALVAATVTQGSTVTIILMMAFTSFSFPLYSIAISHMSDQVDPDKLIPASAGMIIFYGLGSVVGPLAASVAIDLTGPAGLWATLGVAHLVLAIYAVYRLVVRRRMPRPQHAGPQVPNLGTPLFGLLGGPDEDDQ